MWGGGGVQIRVAGVEGEGEGVTTAAAVVMAPLVREAAKSPALVLACFAG